MGEGLMYNKNKNIMDIIERRDINVMHSCVNDRNDLVNGLICSNVGSPIWEDVIIALNSKEMQLALDKSDKQNDSWDLMCDSVYDRLGIVIQGRLDIKFIRVNGEDRVFH
tara:strand:- start:426 stop:755 length:330 start_codon:yes stop_codon:yes gene_type:complete